MEKDRLLAFSDGVIAIIITIMVLELKAPHEATLAALCALAPIFLSYVISFVYVAIYWNNHHHMLHTAGHVTGGILWANTHLLFWLSLIPFATAWLGQTYISALPMALYGFILLMCALAYAILQKVIIRAHGQKSPLAKAIGRGLKEKISVAFYLVAIGVAFIAPAFSQLLYLAVALMWLIPDRRIEKRIENTLH